MALAPDVTSSADPGAVTDGGAHIDAPELRLFVMALFLWLTDKTLEWVFYDLILGWRK